MAAQDFTPIQMETARQIVNAKPDALVPGEDVFLEPIGEDSILVQLLIDVAPGVKAIARRVLVTYSHGHDHYNVRVETPGASSDLDGMYCDQLGELVFGPDAKPWDEPYYAIVVLDENGVPDSINVIR